MKKIIAMLLVFVMVMGLVACGASEPAATTEAAADTKPATSTEAAAEGDKKYEGVTLTMWSMWNSTEPQGEVIAKAAEAFEAETGAHVDIVWKGRDINQVLSASLEAGEKFDIFEDDYKRSSELRRQP